jgi:hypothetical protein
MPRRRAVWSIVPERGALVTDQRWPAVPFGHHRAEHRVRRRRHRVSIDALRPGVVTVDGTTGQVDVVG